MKTSIVVFGVTLLGLVFSAAQAPASFDPVGTWKISTASDEGAPMSVTATITGKPGDYSGDANTGQRSLPLTDLATTPTGMIAVFALPQGYIVVQLGRGKDGKITGTWGSMSQTVGLTAEKSK